MKKKNHSNWGNNGLSWICLIYSRDTHFPRTTTHSNTEPVMISTSRDRSSHLITFSFFFPAADQVAYRTLFFLFTAVSPPTPSAHKRFLICSFHIWPRQYQTYYWIVQPEMALWICSPTHHNEEQRYVLIKTSTAARLQGRSSCKHKSTDRSSR